MTIREDRLTKLVAVCVKSQKTPDSTGFKETIRDACSRISLSRRQIQDMVDTLISVYSANRWRNLVQENPYLSPAEKNAWLKMD